MLPICLMRLFMSKTQSKSGKPSEIGRCVCQFGIVMAVVILADASAKFEMDICSLVPDVCSNIVHTSLPEPVQEHLSRYDPSHHMQDLP